MNQWKAVCQPTDTPVRGARRVQRAQGLAVALFRTRDNQVHALLAPQCSHAD